MTQLSSDTLARYKQLRDPMVFLEHCVYTHDAVDRFNPVKKFPAHKPYFEPLVRLWEKEPLLDMVKSRRMTISWLMIALYLHDTIVNTHRSNFFVSKKEEDADSLVERGLFIYDHIPRAIWPDELLPKPYRKQNHLRFAEIGSEISAVASGADQLRQHTASGILMDEFGFWERGRETYTASRPTIDGGGRVTIISTPPPQTMSAPSFFWQLSYDGLN